MEEGDEELDTLGAPLAYDRLVRDSGPLATLDRDELHPIQVEALRKMTPTRKWELVVASIQMARDVRAAALRASHPDWTESRVQMEVSRQLLLASD
jgi:hypothetical protein